MGYLTVVLVEAQHLKSETVRAEQTRYRVPDWGVGELWTSNRLVLAHDFLFEAAASTAGFVEASRVETPQGVHGPPTGTVPPLSIPMGNGSAPNGQRERGGAWRDVLAERIAAFLAGEEVTFDDIELDLSWTTPFQRAVAEILRRLPRGEVVTYGELAALAGHPGAQRAAGSFCARNRFALLVPCHRVVGSEGIGGYGSVGVAVKRRLLALEGIVV